MGRGSSFFPRVMLCDRFELLFWVLHASHSASLLKRINKVRRFVEKTLSKFQKKYTPTQDLVVDETMLKFHGRSAEKQYMPKKSTKWGTKCTVYCVGCSKDSRSVALSSIYE